MRGGKHYDTNFIEVVDVGTFQYRFYTILEKAIKHCDTMNARDVDTERQKVEQENFYKAIVAYFRPTTKYMRRGQNMSRTVKRCPEGF